VANDAKKISELVVVTTLSANDRVVILANPSSAANTKTITVANFANNLTANNTSYLGGVLSTSYVNTAGAYTISGVHTHSANVIINASLSVNNYILSQNGATSAYATKRVLQYNETTKQITYSNALDAVSPYITGYSSEIHVSPVAFDDSGNGTIGDPVKTIARAQVLAAAAFETTGAGQRKTIILHAGDYSENVTINTQYTVLTTHELIGKNTTLTGTLTLATGCTIDGLKMTNLVITANSSVGSVDIIGCTVSTAATKTSNAYVNFRGCDLSSASLNISGSGTTVMIGGNYGTVVVNNASAGVLAKAVVTMGPTNLAAGTLQISDTIVYAAANTANAITQSAGSVLTLNNSQVLIPSLTNVARMSLGGFYSILHSVYDKTNTTVTGTSLNAIDYSQSIVADNLTVNTSIRFNDNTTQNTAFTTSTASFNPNFTTNTGNVLVGMTQTGNYTKTGNLCYFRVYVNYANVSSFADGSGQYQITLPFPSVATISIRGGSLHNVNTASIYHIGGIVEITSNASVLGLYYSGSTTDLAWKNTTPVGWATGNSTHFDISGIYETT
jgi:hypothetical protein